MSSTVPRHEALEFLEVIQTGRREQTHPPDPSQDGFEEAEETTAASNHQRCSGCSGLFVRTDRMKSEYYLEIEKNTTYI